MGLQHKKEKRVKPLSRKQIRKNARKEKKAKKNIWFMNKGKNTQDGGGVIQNENDPTDNEGFSNKKGGHKNIQVDKVGPKVLTTEEQLNKEKKQKQKLEKEMQKQRKDQLLRANEKEDQTIRKLEKQLKLHKRKTKNIPKSFATDGLDFLLEVCDPEYLSNAVNAEQDLTEINNDFEEDLALISGQNNNVTKNKKVKKKVASDDFDEMEDFLNEDDSSNGELELFSKDNSSDDEKPKKNIKKNGKKSKKSKKMDSKNESSNEDFKETEFDFDSDFSEPEIKKEKNAKKLEKKRVTKKKNNEDNLDDNIYSEDYEETADTRKRKAITNKENSKKKNKNDSMEKSLEDDEDTEYSEDFEDSVDDNDSEKDGVWEDIYGRIRGKDGSVLNNNEGKYIPPAIRAKLASTEDKKREEKLLKLKRQLKGLLNRLAESNMHSIASQIEGLYMNNSRNDMNETLTGLMMESLVSNVATPERLLMEHILLVAVLHANVGTEVGAHFLQTVVKSFDDLMQIDQEVSNKTLDNLVIILAQLYNFKIFESKLLYEVLHKLAEKFEEKNVDCILHVLKNVGFGLRKDDPIALKNLILELQKQAVSASEGKVANSRVKFLLDILMAIKNNNMTKIPNYDPTYSEHLKKIMKGFIRKGNYVTQLSISLEDLLKAHERGKWWVVGSAWTGKTDPIEKKEATSRASDQFSQKLLDLAREQRMNTDTRRDIFCIIMSAEDYVDSFEKLLRLGLKNQQEREIIHVILHCCLQEKVYNPYYAVLAQKFCEYDRKFQMTIKYSAWDKLKALGEHSGHQISNLAKLLTHLFIEKGLPISTLKIVEFSELDKITLRFIRQILLGILLHDDLEQIQEIFLKIAHSEKLKMFRESLRLFIHHFVLRNVKSESISEEKKTRIEERAAIIEKILNMKENRLRL